MGMGAALSLPRGRWGRKPPIFLLFTFLEIYLFYLPMKNNLTMGSRGETKGNIHCLLILGVYHLPEQHKMQATRGFWTQIQISKNQESGQRQREIFSRSLIYFCFKILVARLTAKCPSPAKSQLSIIWSSRN